MTEQEILNEHARKAHDLGVLVYKFCVPFLEMAEHMKRMLYLNREMAELKQKEAQEKEEEKNKLQLAKTP